MGLQRHAAEQRLIQLNIGKLQLGRQKCVVTDVFSRLEGFGRCLQK